MTRAALVHPSYDMEAVVCRLYKCFRFYVIKRLNRGMVEANDDVLFGLNLMKSKVQSKT